MSESVKILIEADDQASRKIAAAAKNVETSVKNIKTTGEQAKKSTEFFGSIANALGGSELGAYASQIAGITEKTSQFAEVQKLGGAGALAFKAGLAGVAGVIAFGIGKALGDVIFQTSKWTEEMAKATRESDRLNKSLQETNAYAQSLRAKEISLLPEGQQTAARAAEVSRLSTEIKSYTQRIAELEKEMAKPGMKWLLGESVGGKTSSELQKDLDELKRFQEDRRKELNSLTQPFSAREQEIKDAEKIKSVKDLVEAERDRLEIMREQVTKGDEAARSLELQKRGVDAITADDLAKQEAALKPQGQGQRNTPDVQGLFSRLLTRGPARDVEEEQLKALRSIGDELAKQNQWREREPDEALRMKVVP